MWLMLGQKKKITWWLVVHVDGAADLLCCRVGRFTLGEPEKVAIDAVEPEKFAGCEGLVVVVESGLPAVTGLVVVGVRSAVVGVCLNRQKQNGGKGN
nr:hypothetical protein Iba_chr15aCG11120 [Ipomoea batatas]